LGLEDKEGLSLAGKEGYLGREETLGVLWMGYVV
jgi:hypothetical protein